MHYANINKIFSKVLPLKHQQSTCKVSVHFRVMTNQRIICIKCVVYVRTRTLMLLEYYMKLMLMVDQ